METDEYEELFEDAKPADGSFEGVDPDKLEGLSRLVTLSRRQQRSIEGLETQLKDARAALTKTLETDIPDLMSELGFRELTLDDGSKLSVITQYFAGITQAHQDEAFAWLEENGHGDVIKTNVAVKYGRGQDELAKQAVDMLLTLGVSPTTKRGVHPQTLKALVRDLTESGLRVPADLFSLHTKNVAKIK